MRERVLAVLERECPDIDFQTDARLATDKVLDSLHITMIIAALTMEFGITIPYEEIIEDNFDSIDGLTAMVKRLTGT